MNLAAAAPEQTESTVSQTVPVVVLGTDALLAAAPYTAVQLAHACLQAGYVSVVPASWGDELVAAAVLRRLPNFGHGPAIQCSCPIVAHRLLTTGGDLRPVMLPLVSPPVALARYLRTVSHPTRMRITYVGGCPGAVDDAIDIRMSPETLIGMLAERNIVLDEQPRVFESIIPPDRRRYFSQPGGVPSAERLWSDLGSRALVDVESDDFVSEIADHLLAGEHVLMDIAPRLGCVCSGAIAGTPPREARTGVVALEPPRSNAPVVEEQAPLNLDLPIPAVPRTPVDVVLASRTPSSPLGLPTPPGAGHRATPTVTEPRVPRTPPPPLTRPITGSVPTARHADGKALPRAYVARRRQSAPKGNPTIPASPRDEAPLDETTTEAPTIEETSISSSAGASAQDEPRAPDEVETTVVSVGLTPIAATAAEIAPETTVAESAAIESAVAEPIVVGAKAAETSAEETDAVEAPTLEIKAETAVIDERRVEPAVTPPAATKPTIVEASPVEASIEAPVIEPADKDSEASAVALSAPPAVGTESASASEIFVDLNQLHFEGIAPHQRLPIFTPASPSVSPTPRTEEVLRKATAASTTPPKPAPRRQSRAAMYIVAVAIAILVVAGVAYVVGRSAQSAPTEQVP